MHYSASVLFACNKICCFTGKENTKHILDELTLNCYCVLNNKY